MRWTFLLFSLLLVLGNPFAVSGQELDTLDQTVAGSDLQGTTDAFGVRTVRINCDRGQTLTRGLRHIGRALLIQFQGTCEENILIERDDVTLRGVGENPTIVGSLTARSSSRITLEDFSVRNSPNSGIEIFEGTAATLRRLTVEDIGNRCINVRNSQADLSDLFTARCGSVGLVLRGSHTVLSGDIVNNESPFGFSVTEVSNAFARGARIIANNNSSIGVLSQLSSSLSLIENSSITANNNDLAGISVATNAALNFFESPVEAKDNNFLGLWIQQFGEFGPFASTSSPLTITGNGFAGILAEKRAFLELGPQTVITDNLFAGILMADSSAEFIDITVKDNAVLDISLRFDAKVTFFGDANDIGQPLDCDDTVLTRGPFECGGAAAVEGTAASATSWLDRLPREPLPLMP